MPTKPQQFIWYDLMTPDVKGAKAFYGELVGWKTAPWPGSDQYEMWSAGGTGVGGVMAQGDAEKNSGAPPAWMASISTDDVDATLKKALMLGGKIVAPAMDIPNGGRYAILADPQGAVFAIFKPGKPASTPADRNGLGHFSWSELNTTDFKAAWKFYSELFGWVHTSSMEMGNGGGEYFMFGSDAKESFGGMSNIAIQMKMPAHWLYYVNVPNCDEAAKRITQLGGKVMNGPMEISGGDKIAQCIDPQGAAFAIYAQGNKRA